MIRQRRIDTDRVPGELFGQGAGLAGRRHAQERCEVTPMDPVRIGLYAMPAFFVLMAVEFLTYCFDKAEDSTRPRAGISWRDSVTNLSIYALGFVLRPLGKFIAVPMVAIAASLTPLHLSASHWWVWVLAIVLADLAYYAQHRMSHRIRMFWAAHNVHHSSQYFNLSTALRLSWLIPETSCPPSVMSGWH